MYMLNQSLGIHSIVFYVNVIMNNNVCMISLTDCGVWLQLCYVSSEEYGRILVQGEENMKRVEEDGRVVAVLEKRSINAHREGYFIVQVLTMLYLYTLRVQGCIQRGAGGGGHWDSPSSLSPPLPELGQNPM